MEAEWTEVKQIKQHKKKQQSDESKQFINACLHDNAYKIKQLLGQVNINEKDKDGNSALSAAVIKGNLVLVEDLINSGAHINQKNMSGQTPLMLAALKGYEHIVALLLERGASVDQRDNQGSTALMYAASGGVPAVVERLIAYKAQVNLYDNAKRRTPLHWAIRMRKGSRQKDGRLNETSAVLEILRILLLAGANPKITDAEHLSPIQWADKLGLTDELRVLCDTRSNT